MKKNTIRITTPKGEQSTEYNTNFVLTEEMAEKFKEHFEIEMLQGKRTVLPDGLVRYDLNLDKEKADVLIKAMNMFVFGKPNTN